MCHKGLIHAEASVLTPLQGTQSFLAVSGDHLTQASPGAGSPKAVAMTKTPVVPTWHAYTILFDVKGFLKRGYSHSSYDHE